MYTVQILYYRMDTYHTMITNCDSQYGHHIAELTKLLAALI